MVDTSAARLTVLDPPEGFLVWLDRVLVIDAYSPAVTSWLNFLAGRLAADFVRELRGTVVP